MATFADRVAQWLAQKEIVHAFGIVGGGNVSLWDAITRLERTSIISVHHEQAAAMAASYYSRLCDRPSLALVTTGAGSTNAITGVMAAFMDRTPLIVISGNEHSKYFQHRTRVRGTQGYDSAFVAIPFTKYSFQLKAPDLSVLEFAYETAIKPPCGPVWVDICKDVQNATQ